MSLRSGCRVAGAVAVAAFVSVALPASTTAGGANTLKELDCISDSGSGHDPSCGSAVGIVNAAFLAISPDGRSVYVTGRDSDSVASFARDALTGGLPQLPGAAACISDNGSGHDARCATGAGLDRASGIVVSSDGRFVYVASNSGNALAIFARDVTTGALTEIGCLAESNAGCVKAVGLRGAIFPALSPDGRNLYLASADSNAVVIFARDVNGGGLVELGCISNTASGYDNHCAKGVGLDRASAVAVSPDGKNVYVASARSSAVAAFARDAGSGALTELGCISGDGSYRQDPACAPGIGLQFVQFVSVTLDGKNVYVGATDSHTIVGFARDPGSGALTQLPLPDGCVKDFDNGDNPCSSSFGLALPLAVVPSADGRFVYTASFGYGSVAAFRRDAATGALHQFGPCVSNEGARCVRGKGLSRAGFLALSPDGRHVYVNAPASNAVAIFARSQEPFPPVISPPRGKIVAERSVRLRLTCPSLAEVGCFGTLRLDGLKRAKKVKLGPVPFEIARGGAATVVFVGEGRSGKLLARLRKFDALVSVLTREPGGDAMKTSRVIRVRR